MHIKTFIFLNFVSVTGCIKNYPAFMENRHLWKLLESFNKQECETVFIF